MVVIYCAYTQQINPAGATPVLTQAQVWKGLERKVRRAQDFVPVITDCKVLEDNGNVVVREATFTQSGNTKSVREVCKLYEPTRVDFHQPSGAVIMNVISDGPSMDGKELNMTYIFEWLHDDVEANSAEYKKLVEEHRHSAKMAVDKSIEAMRKMVVSGQL